MTMQGIEGSESIRGALDECGFDWDNGTIYLLKNDSTSEKNELCKVASSNPRLDRRETYFAVDNTFAYISTLISILGREGIFPAKVDRNESCEIEVNLDTFFAGDPLKDTCKSIVDGITVISTKDVQSTAPGVAIHIVGSRDIPYFVGALTEEEAIKLFFNRIRGAAAIANTRQRMEILFALMGGPEGPSN